MLQYRTKLKEHLARVARVRNAVKAFRLAANADANVRQEIYWPDLMKSLESMLPGDDESQQLLDALSQPPPNCPGCTGYTNPVLCAQAERLQAG